MIELIDQSDPSRWVYRCDRCQNTITTKSPVKEGDTAAAHECKAKPATKQRVPKVAKVKRGRPPKQPEPVAP